MTRNERGVTLLELLVAMMLLMVALLGLAASFPLAMFGVTTGGYQTTATLLAQAAVEQAKATPYAGLNGMAGVSTGAPPCSSGDYYVVTGYSGFKRCIKVQVGAPTATSTTVTVVVRFTGGQGLNDTTLATIFAQ
ncbi:MAG TPA: prepilin-type N-terminal cleavage/methylation domain-containing protein [Methylomirabilota bacterium]|jgi:Tfp pilus assembly protein PilV|nr:prepilin-type N-terminal cleavage/methylation domain-containing protein [Methylomirabilota bacterium]